MKTKTLVIIPAYNEQQYISRVIMSLKRLGFGCVLVVDDGSKDNTGSLALGAGANVISHPVNMGVGAATRTGFCYALKQDFDYVMTFDGDGQMRAEDAFRVYLETRKGYEFVYGCRDFNTAGTPKVRVVANFLADTIIAFLSGRMVKDTQSGLKCVSSRLLKTLNLRTMGYSICSEMVIESIKHGVIPKPVKIDAIYTKESLKKGQKISNSFRVVKELLG